MIKFGIKTDEFQKLCSQVFRQEIAESSLWTYDLRA